MTDVEVVGDHDAADPGRSVTSPALRYGQIVVLKVTGGEGYEPQTSVVIDDTSFTTS
jgi:hypothetical protein